MADDGPLEDWVRIQKQAFTQWCNVKLQQRNKRITDLRRDFSNGLLLCHLVEILSGRQLPKPHSTPKLKLQKISNIGIALDFLKKEGLTLINLSAEDIEQGSLKLIMGLIWILILRYQIHNYLLTEDRSQEEVILIPQEAQEIKTEVIEINQLPAPKVEKPHPKPTNSSGTNPLLSWTKKNLEKYTEVRVDNFNSSWKDGQAFLALVKQACPTGFPPGSQIEENGNPVETMKKAFQIAENELGIPADLLNPQDIVSSPDEKSIMTYVSLLVPYIEGKINPKNKETTSKKREAGTQTDSPEKKPSSSVTFGTQTETSPVKPPKKETLDTGTQTKSNQAVENLTERLSTLEEDLLSLWTGLALALPESERPDLSNPPVSHLGKKEASGLLDTCQQQTANIKTLSSAIQLQMASLSKDKKAKIISEEKLKEMTQHYAESKKTLESLQKQFADFQAEHIRVLAEKDAQLAQLQEEKTEISVRQTALETEKKQLEELRNSLAAQLETQTKDLHKEKTLRKNLESENATLQKQSEDWQQKYNQSEATLQAEYAQKPDMQALVQKLTASETRLREVEEELVKVGKDLAQKEQEFAKKEEEHRQEISSLNNQLSESHQLTATLQAQNEQKTVELNQSKEKLKRIEEEFFQKDKASGERIASLQKDLEESRNQLKGSNASSSELQQQVKNLEEEIRKEKEEKQRLDDESKNLQQKIQSSSLDLKKKEEELQQSQQKVQNLETQLEAKSSELEKKKGEIGELNSSMKKALDEFRQKENQSTSNLKKKEEELQQSQQKVQALEKVLTESKKEVESAKETLLKEKQAVEELKTKMASVQQESDAAKAKKQEAEQQAMTLQKQIEEFKQLATSLHQKSKEKESQAQELEAKLSEAEKALEEEKEISRMAFQEQTTLEQKVEEMKEEIEQKNEELQQAQVEVGEQKDLKLDLQLQLEDLNERIEESERYIQQVEEALVKEREKSVSLQHDLETKKTQISDLQLQIDSQESFSIEPIQMEPVKKVPTKSGKGGTGQDTELIRNLQDENRDLKKKLKEMQSKLDGLMVQNGPSSKEESEAKNSSGGASKDSREKRLSFSLRNSVSDGNSPPSPESPSTPPPETFESNSIPIERKRSSSITNNSVRPRPPSRSSTKTPTPVVESPRPKVIRAPVSRVLPVVTLTEEGVKLQERLSQLTSTLGEFEKENQRLTDRANKLSTPTTKFEENEESKRRQEEAFNAWDQDQEEHCAKLNKLKEEFEDVLATSMQEHGNISGLVNRSISKIDILQRTMQRMKEAYRLSKKKKKTTTYTPNVKNDEVDTLLADVVNATGFSVPLKRISEGVYMLGVDKKIHLKVISGYLVIRVGGGFMKFEEWINKQGAKEGLVINPDPIGRMGAHIKTSSGLITKSMSDLSSK